jgi:hypothetical protein
MKVGSLKEGELYFIGEIDPQTKKPTPFTKVGIVRDQRESERRLLEHQTGNPRQLLVVEQIKAPIVERIETALHHLYAPSRLSGEWFHFVADEQLDAIEKAKVFANEAYEYAPAIASAVALQKQISNGEAIDPSEDLLEAHRVLVYLRNLKSSTDKIEKLVKAAFATATKSGLPTSEFFTSQEKKDVESFDEAGFKEAHPKLWKKFVEHSVEITGRFNVVKQSADFPSFSDVRADEVSELSEYASTRSENAVGNLDRLAELHETYLRMLTILGPVNWQSDLLESRLKDSCGVAAEIRGVCKWARAETAKEKFDKAAFRDAHPDIYKDFSKISKSNPSSVVRRDRGFRL